MPGAGFEPALHFKWKGGLSLGFRVRRVRSRPDIHVLCGRTVRLVGQMWHDPVSVGKSRDLFGTFAVRGRQLLPRLVIGIEASRCRRRLSILVAFAAVLKKPDALSSSIAP